MRKALFTAAGFALVMAVAITLELNYMRLEMHSLWGKAVFIVLFNANIIAVSALVYYVAKNLIMLVVERRNRVVGHRFKTRLFVAFAVLVSLPSGLLFLVASGLGSNYIDKLIAPEFESPIMSSVEIATSFYNLEREKALKYARAVREGVQVPSEFRVSRLGELPPDATESLREAFGGKETTEVISREDGDTVYAAVPIGPGGGGGVILVESTVPRVITREIDKITAAYKDFVQLESLKTPMKLNFLLILSFFTLNILFAALWVSMRIAKGITGPFQDLVRSTEEATGALEVDVGSKHPDEIGLLIESFSRMVLKLKEGKDHLSRAYHESDRRRLWTEKILENIQSGIIFLDAKGNVLTLNTAASDLLGLKAEDVLGKYYEDILSRIESEELHKMVQAINIRTFKAAERDISVRVNGRSVILRISLTGLRGEDGVYIGILVVIDDLTDVIKAQKALAWQEVAKRIAHEIKNPLTPIKLSTERMMKKWSEEDKEFPQIFERSTRTIIREVEGLKRLVDEFTRFGKMPEIKKAPEDLATLIEEVVTLFRAYKGLRLDVHVDDLPPVELDGEQFKRVIRNLVDNAAAAVMPDGHVLLRAYMNGESDRVFIDVADDGPGIKDEDKEKLFLPYFSTKKDGTGLGLAIAQKIVSEHNGSIRVRDNEPRGSVFTIEIPVKESA